MSTKEFDVGLWLKAGRDKEEESRPAAAAPSKAPADLTDDVETVVRRIEARGLDITAAYDSWRDIGFALAEGMGEAGRKYFHRVSQFYPKYKRSETDRQYNQCLKGRKSGITIRTFFQKAKDAGIDIRTRNFIIPTRTMVTTDGKNGGSATNKGVAEVAEMAEVTQTAPKTSVPPMRQCGGSGGRLDELPTFSGLVEGQLPAFLQSVASHGKTLQEKDVLILGSIVTLSACLPNVSGLYDEVEVYPNLYFFLTARASSGKGRLNLCKLLVEGIHERLFELYRLEKEEYEMKRKEYESSKTPGIPKPTPPVKNMLFIPANSSATSVYQILGESNERGLIFETEGDTLAYSFASDFGNFSDGFRKAFHHESISYHRRKDDEHVDIKHPQLSAVLSGTPEQLRSLVKDAENGLFSRFIFYRLNSGLTWKDVFAVPTGRSLNVEFEELGRYFAGFHEKLMEAPALRHCLTKWQADKFNAYFHSLQQELFYLYGDDIVPSVRRMGLIFFRITMILTALRIMETGDMYSNLVCSDLDFDSTMEIVKAIIEHTKYVFAELCNIDSTMLEDKNLVRKKLLQILPEEFDRDTLFVTAASIGVSKRTAERYMAHYTQNGDVERTTYGLYTKVKNEE